MCVGTPILAIVHYLVQTQCVSCCDLLTVRLRHGFKGLALFVSGSDGRTGLSSGSNCSRFPVRTLPPCPLRIIQRVGFSSVQPGHASAFQQTLHSTDDYHYFAKIIYLINCFFVYILVYHNIPQLKVKKLENVHILLVLTGFLVVLLEIC